MTVHPFTRRHSVLGLPIGPREPDWASVLGSMLAAISVLGTVEAGLAAKKKLAEIKKRLAGPLQDGKELLHDSEVLVHDVAEITHAVSGVTGAVAGAGGLAGKGKRRAA